MFRTSAAALLLAFLMSATPLWAADPQSPAVQPAGDDVTTGIAALLGNVNPLQSLVHVSVPEGSRGRVLPALYVGLAGLNAFDGFATRAGLARGAREGNPLMGGLVGHPAAFWVVKSGATAGAIFVAERLWRKHRRVEAIAVMVISNGVMAAVAARNISVLRGQR